MLRSFNGGRPASPLALVLSGGGARAAYQVGGLRYIGSRHPELVPGFLTGVSAGAIIAAHLAAREQCFGHSVEELWSLWRTLRIEDVFRVDAADLGSRVLRWGARLISGRASKLSGVRSLVDTTPLREFLTSALRAEPSGEIRGIARSIEAGRVQALALTASSYTTGQSVTWVQGPAASAGAAWERPRRRRVNGSIRIDHVMASSALPFFFPAVQVDDGWYGDGGIRLTSPLSPAVRLGARRILAVTTRYGRHEIEPSHANGYPPPAQVAGSLMNAVFLDVLDSDAERLQQINGLLERLPPESRNGLRRIDLLVLRPSQDLGRLANEFEAALPKGLRFLVRGLGSRETRANDMLSLLMFQQDYIGRLIELGEADAAARAAEIDAFLEGDAQAPALARTG